MDDEARDLLGETAPAVRIERRGGLREGGGRPLGALNRVNQELRKMLVQLTGQDAIVEHYRIAALRLESDPDELKRVCVKWDCSPAKAIELWRKHAELVFPKIYPSLGSIELKKTGAPGNPIAAEDLFGAEFIEGEWSVAAAPDDDDPAGETG